MEGQRSPADEVKMLQSTATSMPRSSVGRRARTKRFQGERRRLDEQARFIPPLFSMTLNVVYFLGGEVF